ncbi:MAG: hypothetical protein D6765_11375, partial [Bacteroidetes bacterium]
MPRFLLLFWGVCLWSTLLTGQSRHRQQARLLVFVQGGWSLPGGSFRSGDFLEAPLFEEAFPSSEETAEVALRSGWQSQLLLLGSMSSNLSWGVRLG